DLGIGARSGGGAQQRLDQVDHGVAGVDVDARLRIGQAATALFVHVAASRAVVGCTDARVGGVVRRDWLRRNGRPTHLGKRARRAKFPARRRGVGAAAGPGPVLNLPNLITLARILMVPVVVWAIAQREMQIAFLLFLAAGVSDAVDGF